MHWKNRSNDMTSFLSPGPEFKLFGVYHHHEYGGGLHFVWSDHEPTEEEVVAACGLEYEPDRDEWIVVEPVNEAATIPATSQNP